MLERHGVGYETAGALLCAAGDNPERSAHRSRLRRALRQRHPCASRPARPTDTDSTAPVTATPTPRSGPSSWSASEANHAPTIAYIERRTTEGLSKREAIRCLKRYVAREIYNDIRSNHHANTTTTTKIAA